VFSIVFCVTFTGLSIMWKSFSKYSIIEKTRGGGAEEGKRAPNSNSGHQ